MTHLSWKEEVSKILTYFIACIVDTTQRCDLLITENSHNSIFFVKVHLTPKYIFFLNKSLHLFKTHCAFLI